MRLLSTIILLASLAACGKFPDLGQTISAETEAGEYPQLAPLDNGLLTKATSLSNDEVSRLLARATRLRRRAAALKKPLISRAQLKQMELSAQRLSQL